MQTVDIFLDLMMTDSFYVSGHGKWKVLGQSINNVYVQNLDLYRLVFSERIRKHKTYLRDGKFEPRTEKKPVKMQNMRFLKTVNCQHQDGKMYLSHL